MRLGLFGANFGACADPVSLTTFEPLDAPLVERAASSGVDRLIVYPVVDLEGTVRALGGTLVGAASATRR